MKKIYLDCGASTPVDSLVMAAMKPYFLKEYGNSGSIHSFGQAASAAIFKARKMIADAIGAQYDEVIFTGSATEANNLALRGVVKRIMSDELSAEGAMPTGRQGSSSEGRIKNKNTGSIIHNSKFFIPRIIVSAFEHPSILETVKDLEKDGVEVIYIPVNRDGFIDLKKLKAALNERTVLVSVMYVNNEVGTIQSISEIANAIRDFRELRSKNYELKGRNNTIIHTSLFMLPAFHTDAVQAFQYLDCDVDRLGVDLMTISAHKIYGPKGIGALYIRNKKREIKKLRKSQFSVSSFLSPIITGGGQEPSGLWSGTPNTPMIVGFGKAAEIAVKMRLKETKRVGILRDYCWQKLKKILPDVRLNGSLENRAPNNINVYIPGQSAHELLIKLDLAGVAVSSGVACSARVLKPSVSLLAMGFLKERALGSLRITFGRQITKKDIDDFVKKIAVLSR